MDPLLNMANNNNQANFTGMQEPRALSKPESRKTTLQKKEFTPSSPMSRTPRNQTKAGKYAGAFATEACSDYEGTRDESNGCRLDVDSSSAAPPSTKAVSKRSRIKEPVSKEENGAPKKEGAKKEDSVSESSFGGRSVKKMKKSEIEAILSKKTLKDEPARYKAASILPKKIYTFQPNPKPSRSLPSKVLVAPKRVIAIPSDSAVLDNLKAKERPGSIATRLRSSDVTSVRQAVEDSAATSVSRKATVKQIGRSLSVPTKIVKIAPSTQKKKTKRAPARVSKKAASLARKMEDLFIYALPPECVIHQSAELSSDEEPIIIEENVNWRYGEDSVEKKTEDDSVEGDLDDVKKMEEEVVTTPMKVIEPNSKKKLLPSPVPDPPSISSPDDVIDIEELLLVDEIVCDEEEEELSDAVAKLNVQKDPPRPVVTRPHATTGDPALIKEEPFSHGSIPRAASIASVLREPSNISLRVSLHCRLGPIFDEHRIRSLPSYQWMPIPDAISLIVQDLIRCAHRPEDVFNAIKIAAAGEPSTVIMHFNGAKGKFELKNISLLKDVASATKWLTDLLESLGCCKNLFFPTFLGNHFMCKTCSPLTQQHHLPCGVNGSSSWESFSSFDSVEFMLEMGTPEGRKQDAEDRKFRDLWPKEKDFLNLHAFFLHLFKVPEGRNDLRPDIGNPKISRWMNVTCLKYLVARTNVYTLNGKEMWKIGNQEPIDSSVLKSIVTHSCSGSSGSHYVVKTDGTMLELWKSLLLRCPKCATVSSLKLAIDKVHQFIAHERLHADF